LIKHRGEEALIAQGVPLDSKLHTIDKFR